jgi:EAL domain-containing protein (putative c-di-GMP-specific phosphodiesterase class I)
MINPELLKTIISIIDRHSVPHEYIEIELTETTTDVEFRDLRRVVDGLQKQGICTSVDDFGMGYSSLNLIRVVPWNVLKVDKIFLPLDGESKDSTRSVMFKYVVAMAKEIGLECIVEGVETPAQLELLRQNECELAQGYLFDKPLPREEFEKRLDIGKYSV